MGLHPSARALTLAILFIGLTAGASLCAQCDPTLDCNGNGVLDSCDIAEATSDDCNGNGIPDECDIASAFSADCQLDGIPDECQPVGAVILDPAVDAIAHGSSIAIEGDFLVIGDPNAGATTLGLGVARVYRRMGTSWVLEQALLPADPFTANLNFGTSVAIHGDRIAIGAPGNGSLLSPRRGAVYTFRRINGIWAQEQKLVGANVANFGELGHRVALGPDRLVASAWRDLGTTIACGTVRVFHFDGSIFTEQFELIPTVEVNAAYFGADLALEGSLLAIGAPGDTAGGTVVAGAVYTYAFTGAVVTEIGKVTAVTPAILDDFGRAVDISGDTLLVGAPGNGLAGRADLFAPISGGAPALVSSLVATGTLPAAEFGSSAVFLHAVNAPDQVAIGAPFAGVGGAVTHFIDGTTGWTEIGTRAGTTADGRFGAVLAGDAGHLAIGAPLLNYAAVEDIGLGPDCDGDGIEDACAIRDGLVADCDANLVPDSCDIAEGLVGDCDLDGVPDDCQIASGAGFDCNLNGVLDTCDIAGGSSGDCDLDGIPDECETDCDLDGVPDDCAIALGTVPDCNGNGIPDSCDLATGFSADCDGDLVPDECAIALGTVPDCNDNLVPDSCDIDAGTIGDCDLDGIPDDCEADCDGDGTPDECALALDTVPDCNGNLIPDSCDIASGFSVDCDGDLVPDDCAIALGIVADCDGNAVPDSCDIAAGTVGDCDLDGIPDPCETDCDGDGIPDECALALGTVPDCDGNLVPDSCDIASGAALDCDGDAIPDPCAIAAGLVPDCDGNGVPDACDIAAGTAGDCDLDGIPDPCETDCDGDGIPDECALALGTVPDCDGNLVPDSCDIASGTALDCDGDAIPDACAIAAGLVLDCNGNGVPDDCDLLVATSADCDGNGIPDECDIAAGALDCDGNGVPDDCDVAAGLTPDADPPLFSGVPADLLLLTDPGTCTAVATWTEPTATDACQLASVTSSHAPGDAFPEGLTVVTYTATDLRGNSATAQFFVNVIDEEAPTVTNLPTDFVVPVFPGTCEAVATWGPVGAADNCPGATATTDIASGSLFPLGTTTVTATATDIFGNTGTSTFTVTVFDADAPTIAGLPADIVVANDPGACGAVVTWTEPTVVDPCPGASILGNRTPGSSFPVGTTTVNYAAFDAAGNTTTASFTITVLDTEIPAISGVPAAIVVTTDPGTCGATVSWTPALVTENCPGVTTTTSAPNGGSFPLGTTPVTIDVLDAAGNAASASFTVTVEDLEAPTLTTLPGPIVVSQDPGVCGAAVSWPAIGALDSCTPPTVSTDVASGTSFPLGTTTVTATATDAAGNIATATFDVTVLDDEAPSILGLPADIAVTTDPGACGAVVSWTAPTASDSCSTPTLVASHGSGTAFPVGTTTVDFTATDVAGNTTVSSFTVTVSDVTPPSLTAGTDITTAPDPGSCVATIAVPVPVTSDACGVASLVNDFTGTGNASGVYPQGITLVTWTATDANGNIATATQVVTVEVPLDDCNGNGTPDACDLLAGTSLDCNENGIPDECDIAGGFSVDADLNGIPDECELTYLRGDANNDLQIDISDAIELLGYLFGSGHMATCMDAYDANDDDGVTIADAIFLLDYNFAGGVPMPAPFPTCGMETGISIGCDASGCP